MSHNKFPRVDASDIVFEDYVKIRRDRLTMPNQTQYDHFTLMTHERSVAVCARTAEGLWVLTEEYRHSTGKFILGLPGGYLNDQEDPVEGGKRELKEETGFDSQDIHLLASAYPYAGVSGQQIYYVFASNAVRVDAASPEPTELVTPVLKSTDEIHELLKSGHPMDANVLTALYLAQYV
jgi:ADP-ribose pyrophosphatase